MCVAVNVVEHSAQGGLADKRDVETAVVLSKICYFENIV